jgi:hypothetical protein
MQREKYISDRMINRFLRKNVFLSSWIIALLFAMARTRCVIRTTPFCAGRSEVGWTDPSCDVPLCSIFEWTRQMSFNSFVIIIIQLNAILYLFTCWAQQPEANYRVSTGNKYNKQNKTHIKKRRQGKSNKNKYNNNNNNNNFINTGLSYY